MIYIAIVLLLVVLMYRLFVLDQRTKQFADSIPGPRLWPIVGNLPLLLGNSVRFSELVQDNWERYGNRFRFLVGKEMIFFTADVKDIETIITHTSTKSDFYKLLKNFLGTSIFLNSGEEAKKKRRMLMPTFHAEVLSNYLPVLEDAIERFMGFMRSNSHAEIDISYITQLFSIDVLSETAMGVKVNAMENDSSDFVVSFKRLLNCWDCRWKNIFYHSDFVFYSTAVGKEEKESAEVLTRFCDHIIQNRQRLVDKNEVFIEGKRVSFLDALLVATDENGKKLNYEEISYEVRGILIAGHETTYSTFSLMTYMVAANQNIQDQIYNEQTDIFGDDRTRIANMEDIKQMKFLDKTIRETLRLYSIVPTIGRKAVEDIKLDGVMLPKGCNIFFNLFNMGRNPEMFPDPLVFDPDRFDTEKNFKRSPYASIPFSAGPRNCIGQAFAIWEIKGLFSQIIRNYKILPSKTQTFEIVYSLTLKPKDGVFVKFEKRI